ncbi:MAG TPA: hypothetical protein VIA18_18825 [Polyangia bacterium]|nr:hypothetical protein [Polyangia bacterium]
MLPRQRQLLQGALAAVILLAAVVLFWLRPAATPPGFFLDEPSITLNAACIAATGHDEYGNHLPLFFRAFGEYKQPVYIYMQAALFLVLPAELMTARLFSMLLGCLAVAVLLWLVTRLDFGDVTRSPLFIAVAAFVCLLSPWILVIARFPVECTLVPLIVIVQLACTYFMLRTRSLRWAILDGFTIGLGAYVYHSLKIVPPVHFATLGLVALVQARRQRRSLVAIAVAAATCALVLVPLALDLFGDRHSMARYAGVSGHFSLGSLVHLFFLHFNPRFFFFRGDANLRHHYQFLGELNLIFLILWPAGIIDCILRARRGEVFPGYLLLLTLACFIPASLSDDGPPHALRSSAALMPMLLTSAYGFSRLWPYVTRSLSAQIATALIVALALTQAIYGVVHYQTVYPTMAARYWRDPQRLAGMRANPRPVPTTNHFDNTIFDRLYRVTDRKEYRYCGR